ncbi:MAG: 2-oxo acid dehydrogenase subunit E2 [Planctomycetaceae bacterium]|nr:2-oxo acid dehydrogenase subunit E2 [Planctomycetaceae bacterium]
MTTPGITPITVPRLGWSMDEGTFGEWLKKSGDFVSKGDPVFVLEGEKAAHDVESLDEGILHLPSDAPTGGETVVVGQTIGYLLTAGAKGPDALPTAPQPSGAKVNETPAASVRESSPDVTPVTHASVPWYSADYRAVGPAARRLARQQGIDLQTRDITDDRARQVTEPNRARPVSPRARRAARELGVDVVHVTGTGRGGRIRERDILQHSGKGRRESMATPVGIPFRKLPVSRMRQTIARRLSAGVHQAIPVTLMTKADATRLVTVRRRWSALVMTDPAPSYNEILMKLVAETLPECELLNAAWLDDAIVVYDQINLGLAVDTAAGLLVPVLRDVQTLSIAQLSRQLRNLIEDAQSGRISQSQLEGGTFTITNLGRFGVDHFTPVLNLPQSGVLGVGRICSEPRVVDGQVIAGQSLSLSLTFDHRVLDGAAAARWLQLLVENIESVSIEKLTE